MRVIGMMSGTSVDAVDAGAVDLELHGDTLVLRPLGTVSEPYPDELRRDLLAALPPATTTMEVLCRLDTGVGQTFARLADRADRELCDSRADLVVSHGQTVFHWTEGDRVLGSLQIGQPAWVVELTGLPVVSDLRARDIAAGGQGAPLVSFFDVLWLRSRGRRCAALNLGGIANLTVVDATGLEGGDEPVAFDVGPANALLDAVVSDATDGRQGYDVDGALAAAGRVLPDLLSRLLAEPYYRRPAPKSTGKELFHLPYVQALTSTMPKVTLQDLVATLTALTATTVADAAREAGVDEVIASGGGTRNPMLMDMLRDRLEGIALLTSDDLGVPSVAKEAYAFAALGFCSVSGLTATFPSCTGAREASILGTVTPGRHGLPRPADQVMPPTQLVIPHSSSPVPAMRAQLS